MPILRQNHRAPAGDTAWLGRSKLVAAAKKAVNEVAALGGKTWSKFREKAPAPLADLAIAMIFVCVVNPVFGPAVALVVFVASFKVLRDDARAAMEGIDREKCTCSGSLEKARFATEQPPDSACVTEEKTYEKLE